MQPTFRRLTLTSGRDVLGTIQQKGQRRFVALLLSGKALGAYPSAADAAQAINKKLKLTAAQSEGSAQ